MSRQKKQKTVRQWFAWILCICIFLVNAGVMDTVLAKDGRNRIRETTASSSDAEPTTEEIETTAGETEEVQAVSSSNSIIKFDPPVATDSDALAFAIVGAGGYWKGDDYELNGKKAVMLWVADYQEIEWDSKKVRTLASKESYTDGDDSDPWMGDREDVIWHFAPVNVAPSDPHKLDKGESGEYKIYTEVKSGDQTEPEKQYLMVQYIDAHMDGVLRDDRNLLLVTDSNAASDFTVTRGDEKHLGRFSIVTDHGGTGIALNLYKGDTQKGFSAYSCGGWESEWLWLAPYKEVEKIEAVNHAGTVINLFDYWLTRQDDSDSRILEGKKPFETPDAYREGEINQNHVLKFGAYLNDGETKHPRWDIYNNGEYNRGGVAPYTGIVAQVLGADGYPRLSGEGDVFPYEDRDKLQGYIEEKYKESLRYLFDPKFEHDGKESHPNVDGLLQVDDDGYYYYDSQKNFASYNRDNNSLDLYNTWGVTHHTMSDKPHLYGQFFPFHTYEELGKTKSNDKKVRHYFGLTMTTRFVQKYGGHVDIEEEKPVIYEFSGDDDVWVFIDGVLVADLGGIHDKCSLSINFADGTIEILDGEGQLVDGQPNTIKEAFKRANKDVDELDDNTFADNTTHTLKFFYMERGNNDSNMKLKFNLIEVPETFISKVDQYDNPVEGARFAIYSARAIDEPGRKKTLWEYETEDKEYMSLENDYEIDGISGIIAAGDNRIIPRAVYTTDSEGKIVFREEDGGLSTIKELKKKFGENFIMREIGVPDGYRPVCEEIHFSFRNGTIVNENEFETGVDTAGNELLTAPATLYTYKGIRDEIQYYNRDTGETTGTLFGVVLWYHGRMEEGMSIEKERGWSPVYGNSQEGYKAVDWTDESSIIPAIIEAAQKAEKYGQVKFKESANGNMQLMAKNLPGNLEDYYFMLKQEGQTGEELNKNTLYTLAIYWTAADSLEEAGADNTYRIIADERELKVAGHKDAREFDRMFGASIRIPDVKNRVDVQKLDEAGQPLDGADFALYPAKLVNGSRQYIAGNGTLVMLLTDNDGDNRGMAEVKGQSGEYRYEVSPESGIINVNPVSGNGASYTINPKFKGTTSTDENLPENMAARCEFVISMGEYLLREVKAPDDYGLNTKDVFVYSGSHGVYADAGTADDDISVACGPGYLVSTMEQFSGGDQIDMTLTWVFSRLKVTESESIKNAKDLEMYDQWRYAVSRTSGGSTGDNAEAMRTYLKYQPDRKEGIFNYDVDREIENAADLPDNFKKGTKQRVLFTDVGWPRLEICQNFGWGRLQKKVIVGENYQELHGSSENKYEDISHLFSRSVIIQVMDRTPEEPEYPPETPDPSEPSSSEEESTETGSSEESSSTEESSSNPSGSSEPDSSEESSTDPTGPTRPTDPTDPTAPTESTGVSVDVKKVWAGSGSHNHPAEVTVQLYQDRAAYGDPVILNDANGWQYVWTDLPSGADWTVDEVWIPAGYDKSVSREGNSWTIVNTRERPRDDDDDDDPDETTRPDRTHPSDDPSRDSHPESDESRSEWETVTIEDTESLPMTAVYWTDESKPTDETRETTFIPRTGDSSHSILWILVLTGSVAGLGVILVWGFRNRKNEK